MDLPDNNDVHLWRVVIGQADTPSVTGVLSDQERRRAARYRFARDQREFMVSRGVLRMILAGYTGRPAASLHFRHNERGKPSVEGSVQFNLTHAAEVALITVACTHVGVDVERVDPEFAWQEVALHFFSPAERDWIGSQPPAARSGSFFRCWTRREAYVKALGSGLAAEGACGLATTIHDNGRAWSIQSCTPFAGYIAAVAALAERFDLKTYDWGVAASEGQGCFSASASRPEKC